MFFVGLLTLSAQFSSAYSLIINFETDGWATTVSAFASIIDCVSDKWVNFIVCDLFLENIIYPHFIKKQISERF